MKEILDLTKQFVFIRIVVLFLLQDLPKVPVPDLDQTMTEYVRIMEPILSSQQHNRLKDIVKQFSAPTGLGPVLQEYLHGRREQEVNWVNIIAGSSMGCCLSSR